MGAEGASLHALKFIMRGNQSLRPKDGANKDMGIVLMLVLVLTLPEYMRNTPVFYLLIIID